MPFNDGFSTESIPYVSAETSGTVLVADGTDWVAATLASIGGSSVLTTGNITGSGLPGNEVRLKDNITVTNLTVTGTGSFQLLNVLSQSELQIGDKYITILTGGVDHASLDGSGILWGSGSTGPTVGDRGENAHILYRASNDVLEIFPGLSASVVSASVITSSNLYVSNNISASTFTGSFSGSFLGVNEVLAGSNLTSSTAGTLQTLALSSSVTGLDNLQSTNISASYITGSSLRIYDPTTVPQLLSTEKLNIYSENIQLNSRITLYVTGSPSYNTRNNNINSLRFYQTTNQGLGVSTQNSVVISSSANIVGAISTYSFINYSSGTITNNLIGERINLTKSTTESGNNIPEVIGLYIDNIGYGAKRYALLYSSSADNTTSIDSSGSLALGKKDANAKLDINGNAIITGSLNITNNLSASTITGSFSGSYIGIPAILAGANITSSIVGLDQTLALTSSVTGLSNLETTNISASYITGSRIRITDDPNIIPFTSSLHEYNLYSISNHRGNAYFYQELTDNIPSSSFGNLNVRTLIAHTGSRTSIWGTNNTTIISASVGTANFINAANYALSLQTGSAATASVMVIGTSYLPSANLNAISESQGIRLTYLTFGAQRYPFYYFGTTRDQDLSINNNGYLAIGKKDANAKLDVSGSVLITGSLTITTGSILTANPKTLVNVGSSSVVDTYSINNRTARFTAMVETTTGTYHVQSIDLLVANNGSSALITPYALVSTNGAYLASFDVAINGSSIELTATNLSGENIAVTLNKNYII